MDPRASRVRKATAVPSPVRTTARSRVAAACFGPATSETRGASRESSSRQRGAGSKHRTLLCAPWCLLLVMSCILPPKKNPVLARDPRERDGTTLVPSFRGRKALDLLYRAYPPGPTLAFDPGAPGRVRGARGCRLTPSRLAACLRWPLLLPFNAVRIRFAYESKSTIMSRQ